MRALSSVLLWLALALLLAVVAALFSTPGSRAIVALADRYLPLDLEFAGGSIAGGELRLARIGWEDEDVRLELRDVAAELEPRCLWRSVLCLRRLAVGALELAVLPGGPASAEQPPVVAGGDAELFEFPVPVEIPVVTVGATRIHWEGGEWCQDSLRGGVTLRGSAIELTDALAAGALLRLEESAPAAPLASRVELPEIDLPLVLVVDELALDAPAWDLFGVAGELSELRLRGRWRNRRVEVEELRVASVEFGSADARGELSFLGQWPVQVDATGRLATLPAGVPEGLVGSEFSLRAGGALASLDLRLALPGPVKLQALAHLDTLASDLPFTLNLRGEWDEPLALERLVAPAAVPAGVTLATPWELAANGDLATQAFQLHGRLDGLGYAGVDLHLAGDHRDGRLAVEEFRLQDAAAANTLWVRGAIETGPATRWDMLLESSGLDLPQLDDIPGGRVRGQVRVAGSMTGQAWQLALTDAQLAGTVNGLPAKVEGYTGVDRELRLRTTDLRAEVNDASVRLSVPGDGEPGRFSIEIADLSRWQADSRGRVSARGTLTGDLGVLTLSGSLEEVELPGLSTEGGEFSGEYRVAGPGRLQADLQLRSPRFADMALASLRLKADGTLQSQTVMLHSSGAVEGELTLRAAAGQAGEWRGTLAATELATPYGQWRLDAPVTVAWLPGTQTVEIAAHCWRSETTRLCPGQLRLGESGSASLQLAGDMAPLATLFPRIVAVDGQLEGSAAASWEPQAGLDLAAEVHARNVTVTRTYAAGESAVVEWEALDLSLRRAGQALQLDARAQRQGRRKLDLSLQLPRDLEGELSGHLALSGLQLATFAPFAIDLSLLEGSLSGELDLYGPVRQPLARGQLRLDGGNLALLGNPTELRDLQLALDFSGDRATLRGQGSLGGGPLDLGGELRLRPEVQLWIDARGQRHEILLPPYTQMLVSEQLKLFADPQQLSISGAITVHEGTLEQSQLPEGSVDLSDDVVEVDYRGRELEESRAFGTELDLSLLVEDRFRVVGDMVNATLGGDLRILQRPREPLQIFGNLKVVGGELRAYQQRLRIARGTLSFTGKPDNPELDLRAQREIPSDKVVVGVKLDGSLQQPQLQIFSDPVMPQGEMMSYLIRGRPADTGAGTEGTAAALSIGTGIVNQSSLLKELDRIPYVSNVEFGTQGSTDEDIAATVGGYIGERLYLSYGMGIYEPINVLTARLYLQTRLWLEVVSRLENSVDLYYSFDID